MPVVTRPLLTVPDPGARRLLVVDDDCDIREALGDLFRDSGFDVLEAKNGSDGLGMLREASRARAIPDLIILDLMMPVMDGWQFRLEQKRDPALAAIPVIALSANVSPQAEAIDADSFVTKPFETSTLLATV